MRFTLQDLIWLIALVAMGLGWWLDHWGSEDRLSRRDAQLVRCNHERLRSNLAFEVVAEAMAAHGFKIERGGENDKRLVHIEEP